MVANRRLSGTPWVSMLRMYVPTVHKKIEIQKSVKNPYSDDRIMVSLVYVRMTRLRGEGVPETHFYSSARSRYQSEIA
jgi:hypothetical protein